jgi:hypothetical protein
VLDASLLSEEQQGKRVSLDDVTLVVWMEMISTVVRGIYLGRMAWIAQDFIEIDHAIKLAAVQNPFVHLLPATSFSDV